MVATDRYEERRRELTEESMDAWKAAFVDMCQEDADIGQLADAIGHRSAALLFGLGFGVGMNHCVKVMDREMERLDMDAAGEEASRQERQGPAQDAAASQRDG